MFAWVGDVWWTLSVTLPTQEITLLYILQRLTDRKYFQKREKEEGKSAIPILWQEGRFPLHTGD
ncbi:hypothetical protein KSB_17400 [Ktedonobacter robiniae]|uniref:Uncharacterized protein n=1 Tax=Ktedonobacter robiniae TaxID=2778365 RepID=A0ABQ3UKR8_9CHLR|nr:hypothetical protein KSB_17400 [Ktedonobacter robiniae]